MSKIVFLDIDGTIRAFDGYIPETAVEAIRTARGNGHEIFISSGRPLCQIEKRILDIGFDGIISGSGSYVLYHGQCIRHEYFPQDLYKEITETLLGNGCVFELHCHDKTCIIQSQMEAFEALGTDLQKLLGEDAQPLAMLPDIIPSVSDLKQVEKILYFSDSFSNNDVRRLWGSRLYMVPLSFPNPKKWGGELTLASINKAEGIRCVLQAAGYSLADTVAVGDSENDIEMLQFVNMGIAMGNGTQGVRDAADAVTDTVENDGLFKAFKMAGLI